MPIQYLSKVSIYLFPLRGDGWMDGWMDSFVAERMDGFFFLSLFPLVMVY
jgi:hypothetical protein